MYNKEETETCKVFNIISGYIPKITVGNNNESKIKYSLLLISLTGGK